MVDMENTNNKGLLKKAIQFQAAKDNIVTERQVIDEAIDSWSPNVSELTMLVDQIVPTFASPLNFYKIIENNFSIKRGILYIFSPTANIYMPWVATDINFSERQQLMIDKESLLRSFPKLAENSEGDIHHFAVNETFLAAFADENQTVLSIPLPYDDELLGILFIFSSPYIKAPQFSATISDFAVAKTDLIFRYQSLFHIEGYHHPDLTHNILKISSLISAFFTSKKIKLLFLPTEEQFAVLCENKDEKISHFNEMILKTCLANAFGEKSYIFAIDRYNYVIISDSKTDEVSANNEKLLFYHLRSFFANTFDISIETLPAFTYQSVITDMENFVNDFEQLLT